jgi:diguanylate cyclase (GGDEF)-like protein
MPKQSVVLICILILVLAAAAILRVFTGNASPAVEIVFGAGLLLIFTVLSPSYGKRDPAPAQAAMPLPLKGINTIYSNGAFFLLPFRSGSTGTARLIDKYLKSTGKGPLNALYVCEFCARPGQTPRAPAGAAARVKQLLRASDIVGWDDQGRLIVFLKDIRDRDVAIHKAEELVAVLFGPDSDGYSDSMGIALSPDDGTTWAELNKNALTALSLAKKDGERFGFYSNNVAEEYNFGPLGILNGSEQSGQAKVSFDELLLTSIFELLSQNTLNAGIINSILRLVGEYYRVSRAYIIEISAREDRVKNIFSWCAKGVSLDIDHLHALPTVKWKAHLEQFNGSSICCFRPGTLPEDFARFAPDTVTSLQCAMRNTDRLIGITVLDDCRRVRAWTKYQINTLIFVSKIIEYHLNHLRTKQQIQEVASTDLLTGVLNYEAFHAGAAALIAEHPENTYALITCDIERFKDINDFCGHNEADKVLFQLASAICDDLDPHELVCRVSADIFTALVRYADGPALKNRVCRWEQAVNETASSMHLPNGICLAVGVYVVKPDENDIPPMFDRANAARKLAKGRRQTTVRYYDSALHQKLSHEKELEGSMASSLENGDFVIHLQPKYKLSDFKIVGAEALVRWQHPTLGLLPPSDFIPLFERNRFIVELDNFVFEQVCALVRRWLDTGAPVVPVSVNFSRVHLMTPDFIPRVDSIIRKHNVPPGFLEIELTESAFINRSVEISRIAGELKGIGLTISMDDFGSGYSSLNALKDLPVDVLKLDKDFFRNDCFTAREQTILKGFVDIAKQLHLQVVSEGVETKMQAVFLKEIQCDLAQGYYFARPLPVRAFEALLAGEHAKRPGQPRFL